MNQVDLDQIIDVDAPENTVKPIPRDLGGSLLSLPMRRFGLGSSPVRQGDLGSGTDGSTESGDIVDSPNQPPSLPATPALISIKSQTVKIKPDGTSTVDVVLEVEDIVGVTDYEVRIAKSAGNI